MYVSIEEQRDSVYPRTLDQSGALLGDVFDDNVSSSVPQEAKQRRGLVVLCNRVPDLHDASVPSAQQIYFISRSVFQEEPSTIISIPKKSPVHDSGGAYHPPGSAAAVSYASLTLTSSKPFSDIACPGIRRELEDQVAVVTSSRYETFWIQGKGGWFHD